MSEEGQVDIYGGVDTDRDTEIAAVVDGAGRVLVSSEFGTDRCGYEESHRWMQSWGRVVRVGVEGTGSYGAGLACYLTTVGVEVVEVNRPNRQLRRQKGAKTDSVDAEITLLCAKANPALLAAEGVGPDSAAVLLVAAGTTRGE